MTWERGVYRLFYVLTAFWLLFVGAIASESVFNARAATILTTLAFLPPAILYYILRGFVPRNRKSRSPPTTSRG